MHVVAAPGNDLVDNEIGILRDAVIDAGHVHILRLTRAILPLASKENVEVCTLSTGRNQCRQRCSAAETEPRAKAAGAPARTSATHIRRSAPSLGSSVLATVVSHSSFPLALSDINPAQPDLGSPELAEDSARELLILLPLPSF